MAYQTLDIWTYREGVDLGVSPRNVVGYDVEARDGSIGKVDEATFDTDSSSLVVDTGPWIFGKKVMLTAGVIRSVDHADEKSLSTAPRTMTTQVPELECLPRGLVLDGEIVAFNEKGDPSLALLCERIFHGNRSIPVMFVMSNPWCERRALLEELGVERSCVRPSDVFDDGDVLFDAVVEHGLEASRRQETQRHLSARPPGMDEERERLLPAARVRDRAHAKRAKPTRRDGCFALRTAGQ